MQYIPNLPKGWLHAPAAFLSSFELTEWGILGTAVEQASTTSKHL